VIYNGWCSPLCKYGIKLTDILHILAKRYMKFDYLLPGVNRRKAANDRDKVAALVYLYMGSISRLPLYDAIGSAGDAWTHCMTITCDELRAENLAMVILKQFPHPSSEHWFPSWTQVTLYPDISRTEPQSDGPPARDCSLLVTNARADFQIYSEVHIAPEDGFYILTIPVASDEAYSSTGRCTEGPQLEARPLQRIPDGSYTITMRFDTAIRIPDGRYEI